MRLWKPQLALASAAAAILALSVTLFVRRGVIDVLTTILIGAALVGNYLLRRYARAELRCHRHADSDAPPDRSDPTGASSGNAVHPRTETAYVRS